MARLEKAYSSLFGTESTKGQLYGGFYLLVGGLFLFLLAVVVLVVGNQQTDAAVYSWREGAFALAALAAPAIALGISVALPSKRGMRIVQGVGVFFCLVATVLFLAHYPLHFNVPNSNQADYTAIDVGLYVLGAVLILAGTFTSLIGYYLDRAAAAVGPRGGESSVYDEYDVPDAVIEKDIEYAMKKYRYTWGESEASAAGAVQINVKDQFEAGTVVGGKGVARTVQLESPQVDDATKALRGIRPSKDKELDVDWTNKTTDALLAFRKQKMAQMEARRKMTWWQRLLEWLGIRRRAAPVAQPAPEKATK